MKRRRGPSGLVVVLIVVAVLLGLVVGGDRVAAIAAQRVIAGQVQSELGTSSRPSVQIGGFPFLTQVATGRYRSVRVVADDATVPLEGGTPLAVANADVTLKNLDVKDNAQSVTAGQVDATVLLSYASLSQQLGLTTESGGDGVVQLTFDVPIGNLQVQGRASARPVLDAGAQQITFQDASVSVTSGAENQSLADAVGEVVLRPISLVDVPYDLSLQGLTVRDDGIELVGTATNVPLRQ